MEGLKFDINIFTASSRTFLNETDFFFFLTVSACLWLLL